VAVAPAPAFHLPVLASSTGAPTVAVAPAGASIAARDLLPDDTTAGMVQAIRLQVTRGGGEAHIRLAPGELGELTIAIRVHQGQVIAQLQAESPVVREWLRSHQGWLRDSLAEQQLTLGRLEISEPPAESRHADRRGADERGPRQERHPGRRRRPQPGDHPERFDVVA
jgi:flagellar hook-length control protein FliK